MSTTDNRQEKLSVTSVIVSHDSRDELSVCLEKLLESKTEIPMEVFVVDNASRDGTPDMVREQFPSVKLTANAENMFFTRANNHAIERARGKYVLILNPDTMVERDTVAKMVEFMEAHPEAGAASCVFVDTEGEVIQTCWRFRTVGWAVMSREPIRRIFESSRTLRKARMADWDRLSARRVDVVSGAFLIARRSTLASVGFLDERFLLYFTDDDLCIRLKRAGFSVFHNSAARVCHLVSHSTLKKPILRILRIHRSDLILYFRKHHGRGAAAVASVATALELVVWWLFLRAERRSVSSQGVSS
jgi:GT2 family glycosyltransferase